MKEQLLRLMNDTSATAMSKEAFLEALAALGYQPYYRVDTLTCVQFENGRKFRFKTLGYDEDWLQQIGSIQNDEQKELETLEHLRSYGAEQERVLSQMTEPLLETDLDISFENELD